MIGVDASCPGTPTSARNQMLLLFFVTVNDKHPAVSSVVPRGFVCDKRSAANVSGTVSRSRLKIVAEIWAPSAHSWGRPHDTQNA
jgi:hypothetical protein